MKKLLILGIVLATLLTGCESESNKATLANQRQEISQLNTKISELKQEENQLNNIIIDKKEEKDTAKYIVTLHIKQSHFTLDIGKHIKDAMNAVDIEVPVSKEFYDSIKEGDMLDDSFRYGSLLTEGSIGSWKIEVIKKEIK